MKIYTKTGDDGTTSLFDGSRVTKNHLRVEAYGDVDELNAMLGVAVVSLKDEEIKKFVMRIQKDLFALGAQLANPKHKKQKAKSDFSPDKVTVLEKAIDRFEEELSPLTCFILPGGIQASATLHLARTICRRAERKVITLSSKEEVDPLLIVYLNRLSDCLFVLARLANKRANVTDVLWEG